MRIPWLEKLRQPKRANLDAAMLRVASRISEKDSFCIKETIWRHEGRDNSRRFTVTLFKGEAISSQVEDENLDEAVTKALNEYFLAP